MESGFSMMGKRLLLCAPHALEARQIVHVEDPAKCIGCPFPGVLDDGQIVVVLRQLAEKPELGHGGAGAKKKPFLLDMRFQGIQKQVGRMLDHGAVLF